MMARIGKIGLNDGMSLLDVYDFEWSVEGGEVESTKVVETDGCIGGGCEETCSR